MQASTASKPIKPCAMTLSSAVFGDPKTTANCLKETLQQYGTNGRRSQSRSARLNASFRPQISFSESILKPSGYDGMRLSYECYAAGEYGTSVFGAGTGCTRVRASMETCTSNLAVSCGFDPLNFTEPVAYPQVLDYQFSWQRKQSCSQEIASQLDKAMGLPGQVDKTLSSAWQEKPASCFYPMMEHASTDEGTQIYPDSRLFSYKQQDQWDVAQTGVQEQILPRSGSHTPLSTHQQDAWTASGSCTSEQFVVDSNLQSACCSPTNSSELDSIAVAKRKHTSNSGAETASDATITDDEVAADDSCHSSKKSRGSRTARKGKCS